MAITMVQGSPADVDAESPDDAELWVPANLSGPARADWLEGFRSHFEPN